MTTHTRRGVLRNSPVDLVGLTWSALCVVWMYGSALLYPRMGLLGCVSALGVQLILLSISIMTEHHATHTPIFFQPVLNRACQFLFSVAHGRPSSAYSRGHLFHHQETISYSSFPRHESLPIWSLKSLVRSVLRAYLNSFRVVELGLVIKALRHSLPARERARPFAHFGDYLGALLERLLLVVGKHRRLGRRILTEALVVCASRVALCALNYKFFFLVWVPLDFLDGLVASYTEFCTHYGAPADSRGRDAVSSYGRFFNLVWLNLGYHQEHHFRPGTHWSRLPEVREALPPENERRVVPRSIWTNVFVPLRDSARGTV